MHNPTRKNMNVVLRAALGAASVGLRGPAKLSMPTSKAAMAATNVPAITYAKGWLNIPTPCGGIGG